MTKKESNKLGKVHEVKDVEIVLENDQKAKTFITYEKIDYKRGYMDKDANNRKKRDFTVKPIHPGEILREELLVPNNISPEELAKEIKVPKEIVKWVCEERSDITLDLATRLSLYFDTSVELWLNLQKSYEKELAEVRTERLKEEIIPYNKRQGNGKHRHLQAR